MFFDTKSHILPGTESFCSCAQDQIMAYCMALQAYEQGCRAIIATPPAQAFRSGSGAPGTIARRFRSLENLIRDFYGMKDVDLMLGCEIPCSLEEMDDILKDLDSKVLPTMNNTRYVLVSFSDNVSREELWKCLDRLDEGGYIPVISHIQTINALKNDIHEIRCLKGERQREDIHRFKAKIQLDTLSILEPENDAWWSKQLIREGVVDILGTDSRNTSNNPPHIREEMKCAEACCKENPAYFRQITWENAASMFFSG